MKDISWILYAMDLENKNSKMEIPTMAILNAIFLQGQENTCGNLELLIKVYSMKATDKVMECLMLQVLYNILAILKKIFRAEKARLFITMVINITALFIREKEVVEEISCVKMQKLFTLGTGLKMNLYTTFHDFDYLYLLFIAIFYYLNDKIHQTAMF